MGRFEKIFCKQCGCSDEASLLDILIIILAFFGLFSLFISILSYCSTSFLI